MIASDHPGPARNHVKPAILIFLGRNWFHLTDFYISLFYEHMCVYKSISQDIFHLQTMCDGVQ